MPLDLQPTLKGQLLDLRPLRAEDFHDLYAVAADPLIWEQHPARDRYKEGVFKVFFREALESGGALIAIDAQHGQVIGSSRFHGYNAEQSEVEIGWTFLARSHWGGAYNGEMKLLMLRHAFRFVDSVIFLVGPQNLRSQRAVEKIGAVRVGMRPDASGRNSFVYQITAAAFAQQSANDHAPHPELGSSEYLHGTSPEEQARLSRLNEILNQASLRELRLCGGEKILDVGCGLAQLTRSMARAVGASGRVVGIERSAEQLAEAYRQAAAAGEEKTVDLRQGDVFAMPLREDEWGTFDLAHTRFLLEHLPDPLAAVRAMVRAVRVGGRVVLEDDDHELIRIWPEVAGFQEIWKAYMATYARMECDPIVGRRLVELLYAAGASPTCNTWLFFGSCAGSGEFDAYVDNLIGILKGALPKMLEFRLLDAATLEAGIAALREWQRRPDAAFWFATAWAEGTKRKEEAGG